MGKIHTCFWGLEVDLTLCIIHRGHQQTTGSIDRNCEMPGITDSRHPLDLEAVDSSGCAGPSSSVLFSISTQSAYRKSTDKEKRLVFLSPWSSSKMSLHDEQSARNIQFHLKEAPQKSRTGRPPRTAPGLQCWGGGSSVGRRRLSPTIRRQEERSESQPAWCESGEHDIVVWLCRQ